MTARTTTRTKPTTTWGGFQRRVRRLVPAPIRRADLAVFRAVAETEWPVVGPALPRLSHAANHSRLWMGVAALLAAFGGRFGRRAALRGLVSIGVTSALVNLPAKLLTGRARPDRAIVPEVRHLARVPTSTSFPSGHSASAFAFATAVSLERPELRAPLLTLAAAVATSRVYTGVHYPGDVLVGSAIGVAVARGSRKPWPLADPTPATAEPAAASAPRPDPDGTGVVLVANVGAGNGLGPEPADRLAEELPGIHMLEAEPNEELDALLRRGAATARVLGVAGGDGTVGAAAAVAHELGVPLAVVPAGTLNHLAKDLGVDEVDDTVRAVRTGRIIRMDLGEIDGETFVNAASIGTYPHLVADRRRLERRMGKWPALFLGTLRALVAGEPTSVEIDGRRRRVWLLFFGNGRFSAEGLAPTRRRELDDGLLDVRLVHSELPWARTRLLFSLLTGRLGRCASYERWTAEEVHVRSLQGPLRLARDGEAWQGSDEFTVRKRPRALMVLQAPSDVELVPGDPRSDQTETGSSERDRRRS